MARIRTIKPNFFKHEDLSRLPAETQILAAGLLCYADDEGYFNANPKLVQAELFPLRELSVTVHDMLKQLEEIKYIRLGTCQNGRTYGQVIKFLEHQVINRPKPSEIKNLQIEWNDHTQVTDQSLPEWKGMEGRQEGNEIPDGLHEVNYASRLIEDLGMVQTQALVLVVAAAVVTASRRLENNKARGFEWLRKRALDAREHGAKVNRFWFEDSEKWEGRNETADKGAAERVAAAYDIRA
jgi:hypothetical protein